MRGAVPLARDPGYCRNCLAKQQVIDRLTEEIQRLKSKLHRQERTAREEPFGESTPSSKRLVKISSTPEARSRIGGAKPGHQGHGRSSVCHADADEIERLDAQECCPQCGGQLVEWGERTRTVHDCEPVRRKTRLVRIAEAHCPCCRKTFRRKPSDVLPRSICSNRLVAQAAVWHYVDGLTMGHVSRQLDISTATLTGRMHALASILEPAVKVLIDDYRKAPVKHADETGWRVNGKTHWLWCFTSKDLTCYFINKSRGSPALLEFMGETFGGCLITDFWSAYNRIACEDRQYCLAHLFRELDKVDERNKSEVWKAFRKKLLRLLNDAIRLNQAEGTGDASWDSRYVRLLDRLHVMIRESGSDADVRRLCARLNRYENGIFTFLLDKNITHTNNHAEREIRPAVIMRKVIQQNRSDKAAHTQEVLMSVYRTLKLRGYDPVKAVVSALSTYLETGKLPPLPGIKLSDG